MSNIIEKQFESFRKGAFPRVTGQELVERRRMFYAGFQACLQTAEGASDDEIDKTVFAIHQELQAFSKGLLEGKN